MTTRLSVVVVTCDEGEMLMDCLQSTCWADEIVIIDLDSADNTLAIARQFTDRILNHPRVSTVEKVRNFAIAQATGDWVLILDPDERISPGLACQIRALVGSASAYSAYRLPLKTIIFRKWIRYTGWQGGLEIGVTRLFKRDHVQWRTEVHSQPDVDGDIGVLPYDREIDNVISHINYSTIWQFLEKLNRYTTAEAESRMAEGKSFRWPKLFYHPPLDFWRRYVLRKGYRDGMHGLVLSILMALYGEVVLIKMWEASIVPQRT